MGESAVHQEEMIQAFAHDMRSIVTAAVWHLRTPSSLGSGLDGEPPETGILPALSRLLEMTDRLLYAIRWKSQGLGLHVEDIDIRACVWDVANLMSAQAMARGVELAFERPLETTKVRCDRQFVSRILVNLIGNAIKASPIGERVLVVTTPSESEMHVQVLDRGPGIPPRARAAVFDLHQEEMPSANAFGILRRSMEADQMGASGGLGLAFSRIAVEALGGRIGVTDRKGGGSAFWFTLPLTT